MDSIDTGKAAIILMSLQMAPDSKAERIGSAPESSSKTIYSLDEWELQRGHITNLYVTHKKTLPQVMDLMESRYGFVASQRQYKRRIAKWGLDTKNIRDRDMRLALAKDLKRKREGKDTEFEINGRLLPRQKMQRFMVRKELCEEDLILSDAPTPPYVTYHTPHPVEDDDVTNTLASISLGKGEEMADACATHGEGNKNLYDHSDIFGPDKQRERHASSSFPFLTSSGEVSEDTSKILERNEAWLEDRFRARADPTLLFAYARLILTCKKQGSIISRRLFPIWKSYIARRLLGNYRLYKLMVIPPYEFSTLLDFFSTDFESLEKSFLASYVFHEDWASRTSLDSTPERSEQRWKNRLLPSTTIEELSLAPIGTNQGSDHNELLLMPLLNSPASRSDFIRDNIRKDPFHELQRMPTASPFERWSQRYDISSSPNWIKSYMSPSNPLSLLTPAPIGTPWNYHQKASPRFTGSQGYGSREYSYGPYNYDIYSYTGPTVTTLFSTNNISRGLHGQAKIEDLILVEPELNSGEVVQDESRERISF